MSPDRISTRYTPVMRRLAWTALVLLPVGGCLVRRAPRAGAPEPVPATATATATVIPTATATPTATPAPAAPAATPTPTPRPPSPTPTRPLPAATPRSAQPAASTPAPMSPPPKPVTTVATPAPAAAVSGSIVGHVSLAAADGKTVPGAEAVLFVPGAPQTPAPPHPSITSRDKRFEPHVLAVPKGTVVSFPNVDKIFHNAFSLTPGSEFDLGLYRGGASKDVPLDKPGVVRVYCNIHPKMAAYVLVLDRGAFTVSGADGSFRLPGLPPGKWTLKVWHERGGETEMKVEVVAGQEARVSPLLDASRFRETPHLNKRGEEYPKSSRGDERY